MNINELHPGKNDLRLQLQDVKSGEIHITIIPDLSNCGNLIPAAASDIGLDILKEFNEVVIKQKVSVVRIC